jgi:hypothetical protein
MPRASKSLCLATGRRWAIQLWTQHCQHYGVESATAIEVLGSGEWWHNLGGFNPRSWLYVFEAVGTLWCMSYPTWERPLWFANFDADYESGWAADCGYECHHVLHHSSCSAGGMELYWLRRAVHGLRRAKRFFVNRNEHENTYGAEKPCVLYLYI